MKYQATFYGKDEKGNKISIALIKSHDRKVIRGLVDGNPSAIADAGKRFKSTSFEHNLPDEKAEKRQVADKEKEVAKAKEDQKEKKDPKPK